MTKLLTAAAMIASFSISAITPTVANAADEASKRTFTRDGETYVYTATDKQDHVLLIGHSYPSGRAFRLIIRGDRVSGRSGGTPVSFVIKGAQNTVTSTALASR